MGPAIRTACMQVQARLRDHTQTSRTETEGDRMLVFFCDDSLLGYRFDHDITLFLHGESKGNFFFDNVWVVPTDAHLQTLNCESSVHASCCRVQAFSEENWRTRREKTFRRRHSHDSRSFQSHHPLPKVVLQSVRHRPEFDYDLSY
jgi:hypothetical protein